MVSKHVQYMMMSKSTRDQFWRFVLVGGIGFMIDASILFFLTAKWNIGLYLARVISFGIAVSITWLAQRFFVFPTGRRFPSREQFLRHLVVQSGGVAVNFTVYVGMLALHPFFVTFPVAALACGSSIGLIVNYYGARKAVFA